MILIIDTIDRFRIKIGLVKKTEPIFFEIQTENQSANLLLEIQRILKKEKLSLDSIKAILVNAGPGSYTGVRIGVTTANALAWSLNIPVAGYRDKELNTSIKEILGTGQFSKIALPIYESK